MTFQHLLLHISQAHKALLNTQNNHYSDKSKQEYQDNLVTLFYAIEAEVLNNPPLSDPECYEIKSYLEFIFKNIEFLDSSTLNLIPYEIVACLKIALNDWSKGSKYIITTSLINNIDDFSFDPSLITYYRWFYQIFAVKYKVNFTHELIQINLPKAFSRDYLVSIVNYHELGHFVDTKNQITESLAQSIFDDYIDGKIGGFEVLEFEKYFEFLKQGFPNDAKVKFLKMHFAEYFCDLFASQYIGSHLNDYLLYLTENQNYYSTTHPSSINRKKVVEDFLSGTQNYVVTCINQALQSIFSISLSIRFEVVAPDEFYKLLPAVIENDKQLHGIIAAGWDIWIKGLDDFKRKSSINEIDYQKLYSIINNLIEKSIGNYIVTETWKSI